MLKDEDEEKERLKSELKELRSRMVEYEESVIDRLTGLHNTRHFLILAEHEFARANRYERSLSFVMLSLDNLEQLKKTYGDEIADQVLVTVAERYRTKVRSVDILGRYGDEVFVLLLPEANLTDARKVAERICKAVGEIPAPSVSGPVTITISLGVTNLTVNTPNLSDMIYCAEKAMKVAKQKGGNRIEVE
ncbi:GGDEF domain-containing protein [candidate division WOR-3 bacterium]|nr:GGDEF domain-containing protein [candidate division WOR-3 bacterium]